MKGLIFRHVEYGVKHASSWPIKIRVCTVCVPKKQSNWDYRVFHISGRLNMGFTANLCSLLSSISTKCAQSCPIVRTYVWELPYLAYIKLQLARGYMAHALKTRFFHNAKIRFWVRLCCNGWGSRCWASCTQWWLWRSSDSMESLSMILNF